MDYVEELNGAISGFEFKWDSKTTAKIPQSFKDTYKAEVRVVHNKNFREFIL